MVVEGVTVTVSVPDWLQPRGRIESYHTRSPIRDRLDNGGGGTGDVEGDPVTERTALMVRVTSL
jgi:hypothetical protein